MDFPAPVIEQAIEPKTKSDQEKLGIAIQRLAEEDPTFRVHTDEETGQTIIAGMGELHLEILIDRMKREFRVEANIGKPQVAYRETLRRAVREGRVHPQEAVGWLRPVRQGDHQPRAAARPGSGYEFVNAVTGGRIPREYIPAVDEGIQDAMQFGVLAGYPVEDVKVTLRRRCVSRCRLLRARLPDRRLDGVQGGGPAGGSGAAGAGDGGRGDDAGGLPGHGHR